MLAELFILRLEALRRGATLSTPVSSDTRFVAIDWPVVRTGGGRVNGGDRWPSVHEVDNAAIH
jgi:hypothetical protein